MFTDISFSSDLATVWGPPPVFEGGTITAVFDCVKYFCLFEFQSSDKDDLMLIYLFFNKKLICYNRFVRSC